MTARTEADASAGQPGHRNARSVAAAAASSLGVAAAGLAGLVALALVAWTLDHPEGASASSAAIVGLQAWLLANGAALGIGTGALTIPPLLATGLIGYAMYRTGRRLARRSELRTGWAITESTAAVALTYVTVAVILTAPGTTTAVRPGLLKLCLVAGFLALIPTAIGMLAESGLGPRLIAMLPGPGVAVARAVSAFVVALIGLSAVQFIMVLIVRFSATSALTAAAGGTTGGAITIIGVAIFFIPNALLAIVAFGSGAGFSLGAGTAVGLTGVKLGQLPAFPLFGLLPADAGPLSWFSALIPLGAAVFAGIVLVRSLEPDERVISRLGAAGASCALIVGLLGTAVAMLAVGGIGRDRLARIGVVPVRLGAFLAVASLIGVVGGVLIARARGMLTTERSRGDNSPDTPIVPIGSLDSDSSGSDQRPAILEEIDDEKSALDSTTKPLSCDNPDSTEVASATRSIAAEKSDCDDDANRKAS